MDIEKIIKVSVQEALGASAEDYRINHEMMMEGVEDDIARELEFLKKLRDDLLSFNRGWSKDFESSETVAIATVFKMLDQAIKYDENYKVDYSYEPPIDVDEDI